MPTSKLKDNSTFKQKLALRRAVLLLAPAAPVVLETHGGYGRIYERAWFKARTGVVIERDEMKAEALAHQRPTWRVYQGNSLPALRAGLADDLPFDIVDLDPYGSSLDYIEALALSDRPWPDLWQLVVNDGLRQLLALGGAWRYELLRDVVAKRGNNLFPVYLDVLRELVEGMAARIGFRVTKWHGYYAGAGGQMTHYRAVLRRVPEGAPVVPRGALEAAEVVG